MLISNYFPHKHPSVHMTQVLSQERLPAMLLWMGNLYCTRSGQSRRCVWCLLLPTGTCPCLTTLLNCLFWSLKLCHNDHPWAASFRGFFIPRVSCPRLKQAVSLCKLRGEGNEEVERPQFFTESHQREPLTPASWLRHGKVAGERWPAESLCSMEMWGSQSQNHHAHMQYGQQAAHTREEFPKKCIHCLIR